MESARRSLVASALVGSRHVSCSVDSASSDHLHCQRLQHRHHLTVGSVTQRRLRTSVATTQELLERVAEVTRAQTVDERICCRVAVTEPEEDVEENGRRALTTERLGQVERFDQVERLGQVDSEERRPADHEATDNDTNCLGGFLLLVETAQLRDDVKLSEA